MPDQKNVSCIRYHVSGIRTKKGEKTFVIINSQNPVTAIISICSPLSVVLPFKPVIR